MTRETRATRDEVRALAKSLSARGARLHDLYFLQDLACDGLIECTRRPRNLPAASLPPLDASSLTSKLHHLCLLRLLRVPALLPRPALLLRLVLLPAISQHPLAVLVLLPLKVSRPVVLVGFILTLVPVRFLPRRVRSASPSSSSKSSSRSSPPLSSAPPSPCRASVRQRTS